MVFGDLWRYSFHSKEWLPARARVRSCEWKWKIPTRWDWHFGIYHVSLSYKVAGTEVISKFKTQENLKPAADSRSATTPQTRNEIPGAP